MKIAKGNIITVEWGPEEYQQETGMALIEHAERPGEWFIVGQRDGRNYSGPVSANHTTKECDPIDWVMQAIADTAYGESFNY